MKLIFQSGKLAKSIDNSVFHHSARFAEKQSNVPKKKKKGTHSN
jgi:hypothetical protein